MFLIKLKRIDRLKQLIQLQTTRHISSNAKKNETEDQFGIKDVTNLDVMGTAERTEMHPEEFDKKYAFLNNLNRLDSEETVLRYPHGHIRLDRDNQPKYHGQFDEDNERIRFEIKTLDELNDVIVEPEESTQEMSKRKLEENEINQLMQSISSFRENQFIKDKNQFTIEENQIQEDNQNSDQTSQQSSSSYYRDPLKPHRLKVDISKVDIYDMSPIKSAYSKHKLVYNANFLHKSSEFKFEAQWKNWIQRDGECSKSPLAQLVRHQRMLMDSVFSDNRPEMNSARLSGFSTAREKTSEIEDESTLYTPLKSLSELKEELDEVTIEEEPTPVNELNIRPIFETQQQQSKESSEEVEVTALDYMRKLRNKEVVAKNKKLQRLVENKSETELKIDNVTFKREPMNFDSKGFKNYSNQTLNLYRLTDVDRALYLESETFFNHHGFVAFNKPYGLICPGDNERPGSEVSDRKKKPVKLISFLSDYAQLIAMKDKSSNMENTFEDLKNPKLYPIHILERNCTGVYLLAKNKETAVKMHDLFKNKQVSQFFDTITKMTPTLEKATIDIPIEQDPKDRHHRMVLRPVLPKEYQSLMKPSRNAEKAITNYRVLKAHKSAAYLELNPLTSIKHQLRVHLSYGLRTPILGDHLYDSQENVSYQKLPLDVLLGLNVRPTKSFQIPLHLHCKLIILNQFGKNGRDIFLKADLPQHFRENLKSLKLN